MGKMKIFQKLFKFGWEVQTPPANNDVNPNLEGWV